MSTRVRFDNQVVVFALHRGDGRHKLEEATGWTATDALACVSNSGNRSEVEHLHARGICVQVSSNPPT